MNINVDAAQDSTDNSQNQKDQNLKMVPQMMDDKSFEQMADLHKQNSKK